MIKKIKRELCQSNYPDFPTTDHLNEIYTYPKVFRSKIYSLNSKSIKGHISLFSIELTKIIKSLGYESIIFLGDSNTAWLYQKNDYKPVNKALEYLSENKISRRFNGGIEVELKYLPEFIKHLCWLVRCNSALPIIYFTDKNQNILGNICHYLVLHFNTLNKETDTKFEKIFSESKFENIKDGICNDSFF